MKNSLAVAAGAFALACSFAVPLSAGEQEYVPADTVERLATLKRRAPEVRLERFPVGGKMETLILEEFDVLAPNAVVEHFDAALKAKRVTPVPMRQFRGYIEGVPESLVYLSTGDHGGGLIINHERKYLVKQRRSPQGARDVFVEEVSVLDEVYGGDGEPYHCDALKTPVDPIEGLVPRSLAYGAAPEAVPPWPSATATTVLNLAISTDSALYASFANNAADVETYARNLVGAASVIYNRDLRTDLRIVYLQVSGATDPWEVNPGTSGTWNGNPATWTSSHALAEFGTYWHNTPPSALSRSGAVLLSGQSQTAGVAWLDVICGGDFVCGPTNCGDSLFNNKWGGPYAYCGGVGKTTGERTVPDPNANSGGGYVISSNTNYWGLLQFTHELGHNVQSPHTHCIQLSAAQKTQYAVSRDYVDTCQSGECYSGTQTVPAEKGTIMSYCHLRTGGGLNSRWLFGKAGEPSELVTTAMRAALDAVTPAGLSAITAPASVNVGVATPASVTSAAGLSYDWSITNGTFSGGGSTATGASVTFTATANPVTLRVYATQTSTGCAVSDSRTVSVVTCTAPGITTHPVSTSIAVGASTSLSVAATGTSVSYQWYTGTSGNTTNPIGGATSSSINVSPSSTTSYWVRITNSCGTIDSNAATVTVTCAVPNITTEPAGVQIWAGTTTTLSVVSSGSPTLTYQWYTGNSGNTSNPIAGATSASRNVSPGTTTSYWVRVTNSCGSDDSAAATATVTAVPASGALFTTVTPCRVVDSRSTTSLPEATTRNVVVGGRCGVPVGARAIAANVTAVNPNSTGWFALYTGNTVWGGTSTMNYRAGKTRANNAVLPLSPDGIVTIRNGGPATHFLIDVSGYFQ